MLIDLLLVGIACGVVFAITYIGGTLLSQWLDQG